MSKKINVLVYPCGAESALEIHLATKDVTNIRLIGASGKEDHGRMVFKNYYGNFPYINDDSFITTLNQLIEKEDIDIILPTHDSVLVFLAQNAKIINTRLAIPDLNAAEICRSKKKIYELFKSYDFCPIVYKDLSSISQFPVYVKLDQGQGSKGAFIASENKKVEELEDPENYVFMELLPGKELTIDCFTDKNGKVLFMGPRERIRTMDGISVNSKAVPLTHEIEKIGTIVSEKIGVRGAWYFQLKKDTNNNWKLLEASVKIAGSSNTLRGLDVNLPLLMIYDYMGFDVEVMPNNFEIEVERALINRYNINLEFETIYIDFDDTITKNHQINPHSMFFLYHQKNRGKKLILITKHIHDLDATLNQLALHKGIFDEIIHLNMDDEKYKYIYHLEKVIFIDNAYQERIKVKKHLGIPVFDVDAMGFLIDWRE